MRFAKWKLSGNGRGRSSEPLMQRDFLTIRQGQTETPCPPQFYPDPFLHLTPLYSLLPSSHHVPDSYPQDAGLPAFPLPGSCKSLPLPPDRCWNRWVVGYSANRVLCRRKTTVV